MKNILERIDQLRTRLKPVDAAWLKYFAVVIMLIDHTACVFLERVHTADDRSLMYSLPQGELADNILRAVGRQSFPIFCFFLVEGFMKTRSRLLYFVRLLIFAAISQFPFQKSIFPRSGIFRGSVMCTLAIGFMAIWVIDAMRQAFLQKDTEESGNERTTIRYPAGVEGIFYTGLFLLVSGSSVYGFSRLAMFLHTDYSYGGVIEIVLLYVLQKYRIPGLFVSWVWLSWYNILELYSAPAFFMLAGYNGKRGKQQKYFFYIFYPAHLLILWLVRKHFFGL